jgi:hypothetical protein
MSDNKENLILFIKEVQISIDFEKKLIEKLKAVVDLYDEMAGESFKAVQQLQQIPNFSQAMNLSYATTMGALLNEARTQREILSVTQNKLECNSEMMELYKAKLDLPDAEIDDPGFGASMIKDLMVIADKYSIADGVLGSKKNLQADPKSPLN